MRIASIDGLPIMDAKSALPLKITKADIDKSDSKDPAFCAAANACRRQHHVAEVRVHLGRVYVRQNKANWVRYQTPQALRSEIIAFDRGGTFSPGDYALYPVRHSYLKMRGKRHGSAKGADKPRSQKKKRRSPIVVRNVRGGPASTG